MTVNTTCVGKGGRTRGQINNPSNRTGQHTGAVSRVTDTGTPHNSFKEEGEKDHWTANVDLGRGLAPINRSDTVPPHPQDDPLLAQDFHRQIEVRKEGPPTSHY